MRASAALGSLEQRGQPAGLDLGVGVGGGHEPVGHTGRHEPLAGDVHAEPAGGAHAQRWALDDVQAQVAGRARGLLARGVGASRRARGRPRSVARDPALARQRPDAAPDEELLVAGRHADHGAQRAHRPSSSCRRPAS
jgi:hypothetical protein